MSTEIFTAVGTLISGLLSTAFYFDNQRQNDNDLKRRIWQDYKRRDRKAARQRRAARRAQRAETVQTLRLVLDTIGKENENMPDTSNPYVRECYFLEQTNQGEHFMRQSGPQNEIYAAAHFFRAIRVYVQDEIPNLLHIYKTTQRPTIYGYIKILLSLVDGEKWFLLGPLTDTFSVDDVQ